MSFVSFYSKLSIFALWPRRRKEKKHSFTDSRHYILCAIQTLLFISHQFLSMANIEDDNPWQSYHTTTMRKDKVSTAIRESKMIKGFPNTFSSG